MHHSWKCFNRLNPYKKKNPKTYFHAEAPGISLILTSNVKCVTARLPFSHALTSDHVFSHVMMWAMCQGEKQVKVQFIMSCPEIVHAHSSKHMTLCEKYVIIWCWKRFMHGVTGSLGNQVKIKFGERKMCKTCIMSKKHVCLFCKMWNTISFSLACKLSSSFEYKEQTICASLQLELGLLTEDLPL